MQEATKKGWNQKFKYVGALCDDNDVLVCMCVRVCVVS
jgi:hypothetical protein